MEPYGKWQKFSRLAEELKGVTTLPKEERKAALKNLRQEWVKSQLAVAELTNSIEKIILGRRPEISASEFKNQRNFTSRTSKNRNGNIRT